MWPAAALDAGAAALCVATLSEGEALRRLDPEVRILVMGPLEAGEEDAARRSRLEVTAHRRDFPRGLPVHLKVDTGMGRWGMSPEEALTARREGVVGLMSHLATADEEDEGFAREQLERFRELAGAVRRSRASRRK